MLLEMHSRITDLLMLNDSEREKISFVFLQKCKMDVQTMWNSATLVDREVSRAYISPNTHGHTLSADEKNEILTKGKK